MVLSCLGVWPKETLETEHSSVSYHAHGLGLGLGFAMLMAIGMAFALPKALARATLLVTPLTFAMSHSHKWLCPWPRPYAWP